MGGGKTNSWSRVRRREFGGGLGQRSKHTEKKEGKREGGKILKSASQRGAHIQNHNEKKPRGDKRETTFWRRSYCQLCANKKKREKTARKKKYGKTESERRKKQ